MTDFDVIREALARIEWLESAIYGRDAYSRKTGCDCHEKSVGDPDYTPAFQDEYQRLWHESQAALADMTAQRDALRGDLETLKVLADRWVDRAAAAEAEAAKLREALVTAASDIAVLNAAGFDSMRKEISEQAIDRIDRALKAGS